MKYANLHLHSTYSDASLTPEQLVFIGKSLGYFALALTDHETDGGVKEFTQIAWAEGIKSIAGVEFYGREDGKCVHLTALDFDVEDPGIRAFIQERCDLQAEYVRKCVEFGNAHGYIEGLDWNDVVDLNPDGVWHSFDSVMRAMLIKKVVPATYDWSALRTNVFKAPETKALKPAMPSAQRVIEVVRKAGGVIALAHPNEQIYLVPKLVEYGLNGIEISHPGLRGNTPALAKEAAETYNLYRCGGTDHTGPMSGNGGKYAIPAFEGITEEEYATLRERRLG